MRTRVQHHDSAVEYRIASRQDELWKAFGLIQEAYVRRGLAVPNACGMRITPYHTLQTTEVMIGSRDNEVICTASVVHDGLMGLPLECVYSAEVRSRRSRGVSVAEVSCLADRTDGSNSSFAVLARLMSLVAQSSQRRGVDELLIAVHPRHAGFYERFLGFEQIGAEQSYASVRNHPAVALGLDLNHLASRHPRAFDRLFGQPFPIFTLERPRVSSAVWNGIRDIVHRASQVAEVQTA